MFSDNDNRKYLQILRELNENHAKIFSIKELSKHLKVSERKLHSFKKGEVIDFKLLTQYAAIIGRKINFYLEPI